jgi:hypothetical protein
MTEGKAMLDHILSVFAKFNRVHHMDANVLDISHEHFHILEQEYPRIFGERAEIELGFSICLHAARDQPHPGVRQMGAWYAASSAQRTLAQALAS